MLQRVNVRDRSTLVSTTINSIHTLTAIEFIILNTILRLFIRELHNYKIRVEATREIIFSNRSLRLIYHIVKEAHRINKEIQKLYNEKFKSDELAFYKNLV